MVPNLFKSYFLLERRWHSNIGTRFLSEWERLLWILVNGCGIRVNIVQFLKMSTICFFRSLLKILLVNHNGIFFVQKIWLGKGKFLLLCFLSRKLCGLSQAKLMLWSFFNPLGLDIWTFWVLVTLCSMPRSL